MHHRDHAIGSHEKERERKNRVEKIVKQTRGSVRIAWQKPVAVAVPEPFLVVRFVLRLLRSSYTVAVVRMQRSQGLDGCREQK